MAEESILSVQGEIVGGQTIRSEVPGVGQLGVRTDGVAARPLRGVGGANLEDGVDMAICCKPLARWMYGD